jgi:hypothetical protein
MQKISIVMLAAASLIAQTQHNDPYVSGPANESKMAQEIRHQLVMLPYYTKWGIYLTQVTPRCSMACCGGLPAKSGRI